MVLLLSLMSLCAWVVYSWMFCSWLSIYIYKQGSWLLSTVTWMNFKWQCSPGSDESDDNYMVPATLSGWLVYTHISFGWGLFLVFWGPLIRGDPISSKALLGHSYIVFGFPDLWLHPVHSRISCTEGRILGQLFYHSIINWPNRHNLFFSVPCSL